MFIVVQEVILEVEESGECQQVFVIHDVPSHGLLSAHLT